MKLLSVVCIGRNEAPCIERLVSSLKPLQESSVFAVETIYVDSASTDVSAEKARMHLNKVLELEASRWLCAAAGRFAGTNIAAGEWILYLDADMELSEKFIPVVTMAVSQQPGLGPDGWVGTYVHVFQDGASQEMRFASSAGKAAGFGGAVLLRRESVLAVGNWCPFIFSMEETELYARISARLKTIEYVDIEMVFHRTERYSRARVVKRMFLPSGGLGQKFYGVGQVVHYCIRNKNIHSLIRLWPEPLGLALMLLGTITAAVLGSWLGISASVLAFLFWLIVVRKKGMNSVLIYSAHLVQLAFGWSKLNVDFRPGIKSQHAAPRPHALTRLEHI